MFCTDEKPANFIFLSVIWNVKYWLYITFSIVYFVPVFIIMQLFQETNMYFKKLDEKNIFKKSFSKHLTELSRVIFSKNPYKLYFWLNTVILLYFNFWTVVLWRGVSVTYLHSLLSISRKFQQWKVIRAVLRWNNILNWCCKELHPFLFHDNRNWTYKFIKEG